MDRDREDVRDSLERYTESSEPLGVDSDLDMSREPKTLTLEDFLSTPKFVEYFDNIGDEVPPWSRIQKAKEHVAQDLYIHLRDLATLGPEGVEQIRKLILEDEVKNNSTMPALFGISDDDFEHIKSMSGKTALFSKDDIFSSYICDGCETTLQMYEEGYEQDYRSVLYEKAIEALGDPSNSEAVDVVLSILQKMISIRTVPEVLDDERDISYSYKQIGKDITTGEYSQRLQALEDWKLKQKLNSDKNNTFEDNDYYAGIQSGKYYQTRSYVKSTKFALAIGKAIEILGPHLKDPNVEAFVRDILEHDIQTFFDYSDSFALSMEQEPNASAHILLDLLQNDNLGKREILGVSSFLYSLELGKIGIDEGVVTYLERKYSLKGEKKDEADFARRITRTGQIGLFDTHGGLIGYFELGDLASLDIEREADLLEVSRDLLFSDPNTPDDIRQQFLADYTDFYEKVFGEVGGVRMSDLTLREQVWMFEFWKMTEKEGKQDLWQRAILVKNQYGIEGVTSFISLEQDRENGQRILDIAEQLPEAIAARVFATYAQVIHAVEHIDTYLQTNFRAEPLDPEAVLHIKQRLLAKGNELIVRFSENVKEGEDADVSTLAKDVIHELDAIHIQTLTFGSVLKELPRDAIANLDLKEIPAIETIEDITGEELAKRTDLVEKMKAIIRKQFPDGDDVAFEEEITGNPDIRFTISMIDGDILSFFAKNKISEKRDYIDWFISDPDTQIKGLGEATVKLGFKNDMKRDTSYYAVIKPHVRSFPIFIHSLGFSAFAGSTEDGEYKHHYVRTSRLDGDGALIAKKYGNNEDFKKGIMESCQDAHHMEQFVYEGNSFKICKIIFSDSLEMTDDVRKSDPDGWLMMRIEEETKAGFVMSEYFPASNTKENKTFYAVFESDPNAAERKEIANSFHH